MKTVYICSPLGGDVPGNIERAKQYAHYALTCGTAPVVPHFYALILDDNDPQERKLGLGAGLAVLESCDELWVFGERISKGMQGEIEAATERGIPVQRFSFGEIQFGGDQSDEMQQTL